MRYLFSIEHLAGLWTGWEALEPIVRIVIVTICFIIGLWLAFLYRNRWARRHLELLTEHDRLKTELQLLNKQSSTASDLTATTSPAKTDLAAATPPSPGDDRGLGAVGTVGAIGAVGAVGAAAATAIGAATGSSDDDEQQRRDSRPVEIEPLPDTGNVVDSIAIDANPASEVAMPAVDAPQPTLPDIGDEAAVLADSHLELAATGSKPPAPVPVPKIPPLPTPAVMSADTVEHTANTPLPDTDASVEPLPEIDGESVTTPEPQAIPEVALAQETETLPDPASGGELPAAEDMQAKADVASGRIPQPAIEKHVSPPAVPIVIPSDSDPLHTLTGITPAGANALAGAGITKFGQIAAMDDQALLQLSNQHASLEPLRWHNIRDEIRIDARMRAEPLVPPTAATREAPRPKSEPASTIAIAPTTQSADDAQPSKPVPKPERAGVVGAAAAIATTAGAAAALITPLAEQKPTTPAGDALSALDGIDALGAKQLNEAGIHSYKDVAQLEQADFEKLSLRFMGLRKFSWPFWQGKLKAQAAGLAGIELPEAPPVEPTPSEKKPTPKTTSKPVVEKLSAAKEKITDVSREAAQLTREPTRKIKESLSDARDLAGTTAGKGGAIAAQAGGAISGAAKQLTDLVKAEFKGEDVSADPALGVVYNAAPTKKDDLASVEGIDAHTATSLNACGIYTFQQLAHFTDHAPASLAKKSAVFAQIDWNKVKLSAGELQGHPVREAVTRATGNVKQAANKVVAETKAKAEHIAETVTDPDKRSAAIEKQRTDLEIAAERVKNITSKVTEGARGAVGDIKEHVQETVESIKEDAGEHRDLLTDTAVEGSDLVDATSAHALAAKPSLKTRAKHLGDFVEARVYGDRADADDDKGFRYQQAPRDADDLTRLPGLQGGHAGFLNALGIYKIRQVANWSDKNIQTIAREEPLLQEHDLRLWRAEARIKPGRSGFRNAWDRISDTARSTVRYYFNDIPPGFAGEDVEMGPYGAVYCTPPPQSDPLDRITGISPEIALQLNRIGIFRFKQVATWGVLARRNVTSRLELPASADLENWVSQAGRMAG